MRDIRVRMTRSSTDRYRPNPLARTLRAASDSKAHLPFTLLDLGCVIRFSSACTEANIIYFHLQNISQRIQDQKSLPIYFAAKDSLLLLFFFFFKLQPRIMTYCSRRGE